MKFEFIVFAFFANYALKKHICMKYFFADALILPHIYIFPTLLNIFFKYVVKYFYLFNKI